jgi:hypothetical protein
MDCRIKSGNDEAYDHVMPGLVPGIHVLAAAKKDVDGRVKPGHDGVSERRVGKAKRAHV